MYFVGIDCAKYKNDCFIMNESLLSVGKPFTFNNSKDGFQLLLEVLKDLGDNDQIKIGFEATGHYTLNLKLFLESNGFTYMELNPNKVHRFIKTISSRNTKTDLTDSKYITRYLSQIEYIPYPVKFYHIYNLRSLTRTYESLIHERSLMITNITNCLDKIFPEFKPFFKTDSNGKLKNPFPTSTVLYILKNYPSVDKIKNMSIASYNKMKGELRHTISYERFCTLKELASSTIGHTSDIFEYELSMYLEMYEFIDSKIQDIVSKIESEMNTHFGDSKTKTIRGIGLISAATIISEIGVISNYSNSGQILAFAGLDPGIKESGSSIHYKCRMVKHGSPHLRYVIMNCIRPFIMHNPVISDYYHKKIKEGKHRLVAYSHVARKLIKLIFTLEKNKIDFNQDLLK